MYRPNRHLLRLARLNAGLGRQRRFARFFQTFTTRRLQTVPHGRYGNAYRNFYELIVQSLGHRRGGYALRNKSGATFGQSPNAEYSSAMLFVLNATSLQLVPTSIIAVRTSLHSAAPTDILLPTLITTVCSTVIGVTLTWLFLSKKTPKVRKNRVSWLGKRKNRTGAGIL